MDGLPIVDIIVAAILLIFLIIGMAKGFLKGVLALVGTVVSLIAAYFLAQPFIEFVDGLFNGGVVSTAQNIVSGWIGGIPGFSEPITDGNVAEQFKTALLSLKIPESMAESISVAIANALNLEGVTNGQTVAGILSPVLADFGLSVIAVLILFVLIRLAVYIIEKILDATLLKVGALRSLDRLLGMVFGLLQGLLIVIVLLTGVSLFLSNPDSVVLNAIEDSTFTNWLYINNPLPAWITANLDIESLLQNLFGSGG